ncbi:MAG: flagellar hook-associated protein FlgK [Thermosulfidibacteraceae bacterium]
MSGLFGLLSVGVNSLLTYQRALNTTSENISNVNTSGYARRVPVFEELQSFKSGRLYFSSGVDLEIVRRMVDSILDRRLNLESGNSAFWEALNKVASSTETVLNEASGNGLSGVLNSFFKSWEALATSPEGITERDQIVANAVQFIETVRDIDSSLELVVRDGMDRIRGWINDVNRIASDIANLNRIIKASSFGNNVPNDLMDKLNADLKELMELTGGYYSEKPNGMVQVFLPNGVTIVDGENYIPLVFDEGAFIRRVVGVIGNSVFRNDVTYEEVPILKAADEDVTKAIGGRIGGTLRGFVDVVDEVRLNLNRLVSEIVYNVNRIHSTGMGLQKLDSVASSVFVSDKSKPINQQDNAYFKDRLSSGAIEVRVYNSSGEVVEAKTVTVSLDEPIESLIKKLDLINHLDAFISSNGQIVFKSDPGYYFSFYSDSSGFLTSFGINTFFIGDGINNVDISPTIKSNHLFVAAGRNFESGDNSIAREISDLANSKLMEGGFTFGQYYDSLVGQLGTTVKRIEGFYNDSKNLVEQLTTQRESISGVNLDEEFVNLLKFQRAFQASARYITAVDEMLATIVERMGVVGR